MSAVTITGHYVSLVVESESCPFFDLDAFGWVQTAANRLMCDYNSLTRWLMGLEPLSLKTILTFPAGALVLPFGVVLALLGRWASRGAFLEALATRGGPA